MRSTESISASDALFRGVVRHGFRKNRQGNFWKRSFQLLTGSPGPSRVPEMTVFSRVTAAFFPKNRLGQVCGPGGYESGDEPWRPPSTGRVYRHRAGARETGNSAGPK